MADVKPQKAQQEQPRPQVCVTGALTCLARLNAMERRMALRKREAELAAALAEWQANGGGGEADH